MDNEERDAIEDAREIWREMRNLEYEAHKKRMIAEMKALTLIGVVLLMIAIYIALVYGETK